MTEESTNLGELFAALAKAQGQMAAADKDRSVGFDTREDSRGGPQRVKYSYATLAGVWEACRKPLSENGLAVVQQVTQATGNSITINSILGHASGQSINSLLTMPVVGGTAQAVGSAITYARRYSLMALVGIVADEDDDGQEASGKGEKKATPRPIQQAAPIPAPAQPAKPAPAQALPPTGEDFPGSKPAQKAADLRREINESLNASQEMIREAAQKAASAQPAPLNDWIANKDTRVAFWAQALQGLGYTEDGVHKTLGVTSMRFFKGTYADAVDALMEAKTPIVLPPFAGEDVEQEELL